MTSIAIEDMLERGLLQRVDTRNLEAFLQAPGLQVLFFAGSDSQRSDAHDVAVALREVLKDYGGAVSAALVAEEDEAELQPRFRILALPSLALVLGGETLEVIPRVRDWSDYIRAFQRYLGAPAATDTANWGDDPGPGNLRISYVIPDRAFRVMGSGVLWPAPDAPGADMFGDAGPVRHHMVWVDLVLD